MSESLKTAAFLGVAVALAIAAGVSSPESRVSSVFSDEGQAFYPQFRDPQAVKAVEVIDYDDPTATARPLKVELRKSRWVIATNNDYPIDVGDRLVKTAAALMDLHKDRVASDRPQDQSKFGVIDPVDQKVSDLTGRGKRVTLRDAQKNVLADFILGKPVEGKAGWRYLRVPGARRTYAVKTDADPSAKFADWVNAGLLRMPAANIRKITINSYAVNTVSGTVDPGSQVSLTKDLPQWKSVTGTLDSLKIVDARPKPPEMAHDLQSGQMVLSMETALVLRRYGFLLTQTGRVLATDGEMSVDMNNGVKYMIRFGDATSSGDRYLFVTTGADPAQPEAEKASHDLNVRFADWFYVIANPDFQKLRLK